MIDPLQFLNPASMFASGERFHALWKRIDCTSGSAGQTYAWLMQQYNAGRAYHNAQHIGECLMELQGLRDAKAYAESAVDLDAVEIALWFHDVVYEPRVNDNEERSANAARFVLQDAGASEDFMSEVHRLIMVTKAHEVSDHADLAAALMVDIDLSILGKPLERFRQYDDAIRMEYLWVPFPTYAEKRVEVLRGFIAREPLFKTAWFLDKYEEQAKENLKWAVEKWEKAAKNSLLPEES